MRFLLALFTLGFLAGCSTNVVTGDHQDRGLTPPVAPARAAPTIRKPLPSADPAGIKFEKFELKDAKLLTVMGVVRSKAYFQGQKIDIVFKDPKGELDNRPVSLNLTNTTVGQVMEMLSRLADFKYSIEGNTITLEPK